MSANRSAALESIRSQSDCLVQLITPANLADFVPPKDLHPAYLHLNLAHRSDYLRCYFMRRYGGGYADIKHTTQSWKPHFDLLNSNSDLWIVGYREVGKHGVANLYTISKIMRHPIPWRALAWLRSKWLDLNWQSLIGCCAFICRPGTPLLNDWWHQMNHRLNMLAPHLKRHPARLPHEKPGDLVDGAPSQYPVPWLALNGGLFQPLGWKYRHRTDKSLNPPKFTDYQ